MPDSFEFFKKADTFFQLYYDGKYTNALVLAEKLAIEYPEKDARTAFWLVCLQNLTGQSGKALRTFKDALARGTWWAESQLRSDSDLESLQGDEEFESLVMTTEH